MSALRSGPTSTAVGSGTLTAAVSLLGGEASLSGLASAALVRCCTGRLTFGFQTSNRTR
ncbi:MAG: hypothetical protein ACK56I_14335 [bacterium]